VSSSREVRALSPLVDGMTYTGTSPRPWNCRPGGARRSTAARHPANPTKHTALGRSQRTSRSPRASPSRYAAVVSSSAATVARLTRSVIPMP